MSFIMIHNIYNLFTIFIAIAIFNVSRETYISIACLYQKSPLVSPGTETDCVSRSFCPKLSIPEDPVCGSAHCQIAAYWADELHKKEILAYQAS